MDEISNRLILGDSCDVLSALLNEAVKGKISCVFISPPFNSEFKPKQYQNNYTSQEYLDFMSRILVKLYLMLNKTGLLWVHIDEHYSHHIKILLDKIFINGQFITELIYHCPDRIEHYNYTPFYPQCERILLYSKEPTNILREKFLSKMKKDNNFLSDLWVRNANNLEKEGGMDFLGGKIPEVILKQIIELSTLEDEYVLDCFAGSGTTGRVAQKLGRKWILIEKNNQTFDKLSSMFKRLYHVPDSYGIEPNTDFPLDYSFISENLYISR